MILFVNESLLFLLLCTFISHQYWKHVTLEWKPIKSFMLHKIICYLFDDLVKSYLVSLFDQARIHLFWKETLFSTKSHVLLVFYATFWVSSWLDKNWFHKRAKGPLMKKSVPLMILWDPVSNTLARKIKYLMMISNLRTFISSVGKLVYWNFYDNDQSERNWGPGSRRDYF